MSVILKNSIMGGYIDHHPTAADLYGIHELSGDYADMAKALGAYAERITDPADVSAALKRGLAQNAEGVPAVIEVITSDETRMAKNLPDGV